MNPDSACFVCGVDLGGDDSTGLRCACRSCKARVRLVVGGASLVALLRADGPHPIEGSGLNPLLNPIEIDGRRCWADFAAGGWAVFEERWPSSDWFSFAVQHRPTWPTLRQRLRSPGKRSHWPKEPSRAPAELERFVDWWVMNRDAQRTLSSGPPLTTPESLRRVVAALPELAVSATDGPECWKALVALARLA